MKMSLIRPLPLLLSMMEWTTKYCVYKYPVYRYFYWRQAPVVTSCTLLHHDACGHTKHTCDRANYINWCHRYTHKVPRGNAWVRSAASELVSFLRLRKKTTTYVFHPLVIYMRVYMMTSSNGNLFRVTGPLCGEFTGHQWIPRTKTSDAELWCFLWSAHWINGWANTREAGNLRRQCAHYDVIVMVTRIVAYVRVGNSSIWHPYGWYLLWPTHLSLLHKHYTAQNI